MDLAVISEQNGVERDQKEHQWGTQENRKFCKEIEKETNSKGRLEEQFETGILAKQ